MNQLPPTIFPEHEGRQPTLHDRTSRKDEGRLVDDPAQRALLVADRILGLQAHPFGFEGAPQAVPFSEPLSRYAADREGSRFLGDQLSSKLATSPAESLSQKRTIASLNSFERRTFLPPFSNLCEGSRVSRFTLRRSAGGHYWNR